MFEDDMDVWQFVKFYALIEIPCISSFMLATNVAINDAEHHNINHDKQVFE
jgi:hypothetical protein